MALGDQSRYSKEIQAFGGRMQDLENVIYDIATKRGLETATGLTLDYLGEIPGVSRPIGMSDNDYRNLIKWKILVNRSGGEPDTLLDALKILTGADDVNIIEMVCFVWMEFTGGTIPADLYGKIKRLVAGGVGLELINAPTGAFRLDSSEYGLDNGLLSSKVI